MMDEVQVERYFYIDDHCGIAYVRRPYSQSAYTASCASLEMRADGLHFSQWAQRATCSFPVLRHEHPLAGILPGESVHPFTELFWEKAVQLVAHRVGSPPLLMILAA